MSQLFHQLVQPMATTDTLGAFLNGLRIVGKRWHLQRLSQTVMKMPEFLVVPVVALVRHRGISKSKVGQIELKLERI